MKRVGSKFYMVIFISLLFIFSCSNDDHIEKKMQNEMALSMDNADLFLNSDNTEFITTKSVNEFGMLELNIRAKYQGEMDFAIKIPGYMGPKKYEIGTNHYMGMDVEIQDLIDGSTWQTDLGSTVINGIEILEDDGRIIRGNFAFDISNAADQNLRKTVNGNLILGY
ncbi:MAG TPA: hypothetical protein VJ973_01170 [Christiangramia sp.]|nr:hypothetical protein [Christiangramia sp.]